MAIIHFDMGAEGDYLARFARAKNVTLEIF